MGTWGTGIYEGDLAADIREDYKTALKYSNDDKHALQIFLDEHKNELEDDDDGPVTWLVLAQSMWKMGRLTDDVLKKAKQAAEDDLKNWEDYSEREYKSRKKNLEKFIAQLSSTQTEMKPVKRVPPFICDWKRGDAFLWKDKGVIFFNRKGENQQRSLQDYGIVIIFDKIFRLWDKDFLKVYLKFSETTDVKFEDLESLPYIFARERIPYEMDGKKYNRIEHNKGYCFGIIIKGTDFSDKLKYLGNYSFSDLPEQNDKAVPTSYVDRWRVIEEAMEYFIPQYYGVENVIYIFSPKYDYCRKDDCIKTDSIL